MKKSVLARSLTGAAGAAAVAGVTIAMAPAASAQLAITSSTAYCVSTTYTITFPSADAQQMASQSGASSFVLQAVNGTNTWWSAPVTYTSGQDVTFQWTPSQSVTGSTSAVGNWNLYVGASGVAGVAEGPLSVNVVQTAPSGATCSPSTLGTGSANMTVGQLISNLLAGLSAAQQPSQ
ncbi:hypothetical protein GPX89_15835 [Nocardia sp. ET3-3]|uniref:Uncharacterized protein n=1 Tax=Nocardia terrae TaxID=2675851 RepID=A0A7K1UWF0_9NOCA|nr:hypothetical protein [Nocardia terrae]MVU78710.1 hypothetical protein [Nocardia terrae]